MSTPFEQLLVLHRSPSGQRMFRYTLVSVICLPISFAVLFLVYGVLRLWTEVPAVLFANCVAGVPSYFLNRNWVWGRSGRSHLVREVIPFWVVSLTGVALSLLAAAEARQFGIAHHLSHEARTVLVLTANVAAFASLWLVKYVTFHRLFHLGGESTWAEADAA
jgi:putative flippase GtrA